jgi:DNA-binding beta-propeller fold protein YncE
MARDGLELPLATATEAGADLNTPTGTKGLFIVCKSAGIAAFYDPRTFTKEDEIRLPDFPHEVVLSPDRATAYVSIYGNGQVGTNTKPGTRIAVIDLAGRKLQGFIELAPFLAPHGMMFDRAGQLWSTAELSNAIVVVDPVRGRVAGYVPVGSHRTHFLTVTPDGAKVYAPHRQLKMVSVIDTATRAEVKRIPNFRYECQGVAAAPDGNRIYQAASARPEIAIIDPVRDEVAGTVTVAGLGDDFPPQLTRLKVSPDNRHLVVSYNVSRRAAVIDTQELGRQVLFPLEAGPMGIGFAAGNRALVTNHDAGSVTVIDLGAMKLEGRFETPLGAETMAFY